MICLCEKLMQSPSWNFRETLTQCQVWTFFSGTLSYQVSPRIVVEKKIRNRRRRLSVRARGMDLKNKYIRTFKKIGVLSYVIYVNQRKSGAVFWCQTEKKLHIRCTCRLLRGHASDRKKLPRKWGFTWLTSDRKVCVVGLQFLLSSWNKPCKTTLI